MGFIDMPTLPEGVELDPFNLKNSEYVIYRNGKIYWSSWYTVQYGVKIAPKPGYKISGGKLGSAVTIEKDQKTARPQSSDFFKEAEDMLAFCNDDDKNYIGLSPVDVIASAICKREDRIFELEQELSSKPPAHQPDDRTWEGFTDTEILKGILDSVVREAKVFASIPEWLVRAICEVYKQDGMNGEHIVLYAWKKSTEDK